MIVPYAAFHQIPVTLFCFGLLQCCLGKVPPDFSGPFHLLQVKHTFVQFAHLRLEKAIYIFPDWKFSKSAFFQVGYQNLNILGHVPFFTENAKFLSYHPKTEGSIHLTALVELIPCKAINILVIPFNTASARSNSRCMAPFFP